MREARSKAKVRSDIKKNRLYIIFDIDVKKNDVEQIYTDIRFGVADLQPGFSVINDLSNASIGHLSGASTFKRISDFLCSKEVGRVIRVIGGSSLLFRQISKLSDSISGYKPEYVESIEAAEQLLDNEMKSSEIP